MAELTNWSPGVALAAEVQAVNAAAGRQDYVRGDGTVTGFDAQTRLIDAGALAGGATYKYRIPTGGSAAVDVTLGFSAQSATAPTAKIYPAGADGKTQKVGTTATNFAAFVQDTPQTVSYTALRGERYVILEITTAAANPATPSVGEYSAL